MGRNRSVSPPPEFTDEAKSLWRSAVRQLQEQGTWRSVDGPLLESYVASVLCARAARRAGQNDTAAVAERDAAERAASLMLTPDTRRHAPNGKPRTSRPAAGIIEATGGVIGVS